MPFLLFTAVAIVFFTTFFSVPDLNVDESSSMKEVHQAIHRHHAVDRPRLKFKRSSMSAGKFRARRGRRERRLDTQRKVLLLSGTANSTRLSANVVMTLETYRVPVDRFVIGKDPTQKPRLKVNATMGMYSTVIIDDVALYLLSGNSAIWRETLDKYCAEFSVGQILFGGNLAAKLVKVEGKRLPVDVLSGTGMTHAKIDKHSALLRIARDGGVVKMNHSQPDSITFWFESYHREYEAVQLMWHKQAKRGVNEKKVSWHLKQDSLENGSVMRSEELEHWNTKALSNWLAGDHIRDVANANPAPKSRRVCPDFHFNCFTYQCTKTGSLSP